MPNRSKAPDTDGEDRPITVSELADHGAGDSANLWIMGGIALLVLVLPALIGVAQTRDPQRAERMEVRRALLSAPRRLPEFPEAEPDADDA